MEVLEGQTFCFADVEVDTRRGCVRRGDGEHHLRQKSFQVLVYLLERRDRLVTKNELIETVWRDTAVTDDVLVQCIKEIRRSLGDDTHSPRFIKTVPKAGYRFIGSMSEAPILACGQDVTRTHFHSEDITRVEIEYEVDDFLSRQPDALISRKPRDRTVIFALLAVALLVTGLSYFYFAGAFRSNQAAGVVLPDTPGKRSLAVMYFENRSRNSELDWMSEGLADMMITDLSRSPKLNILSRQDFRTLLDRNGVAADETISPETALDIARKSRAGSFILGSFASVGTSIRLDVKLFDAQTGELRAVETSNVEKAEMIFSAIDLLSLKLANHLVTMPFEQDRRSDLSMAMTGNLEAYRYYSLAVDEAQSLHNKEAIALLEKAIALDPQFAMAHARIGYIYTVTWGFGEKAKPYLEKAFALSDRLTEKDRLSISAWYSIASLDYPNAIEFYRQIISKYPTETESYLRLGNLLSGEEQFEDAANVLKQGLAIDPDGPLLYNALGSLYSISGKHEDAISMHQRYVAYAPNEANAHDSLGMSFQWAGRYDEAIGEYRRAIELKPNFEVALVHLANTHFQTGRYSQAIDLYKKYNAGAPSELERARAFSSIATVYRRLRNYDLAIRAANQAIKERETYIGESFLIALDLGDKKTTDQLEQKLFAAQTVTNRGKRAAPRFSFYFRGLAALRNGEPDNAVEAFREAVRHSPPTFEADALEDCLANAYLHLGRYDEAVAEYERVLALNPNYPLARFHLAQTFAANGDTEKARENYRLFLDTWKDADNEIPEIIAARNYVP